MNVLKGSKNSKNLNFENISIEIPNHFKNLEDKDYNFGIRALIPKL